MKTTEINTELTTTMLFVKGDKMEFDLFFDKYASVLYGLILGKIGDQKVSETLLSNVIAEIWQNFGTLSVGGSNPFLAYYSITQKHVLKYQTRHMTLPVSMTRMPIKIPTNTKGIGELSLIVPDNDREKTRKKAKAYFIAIKNSSLR